MSFSLATAIRRIIIPEDIGSILQKKPSQRRLAIMKRMAVTIFRIMLLLNEESIGRIAGNP
jgi:hypothetical protein